MIIVFIFLAFVTFEELEGIGKERAKHDRQYNNTFS